MTIIVGHRGAAGVKVENTLESIDAAINSGIEMIEVDVQQTIDSFIVFHDHRLDRLTNGSGRVNQVSSDVIRRLSVSNQCVPFLSDVLRHTKNRIKVNLEIKYCNDVTKLLSCIQSTNFPVNDLLITSYNHELVKNIKQTLPQLTTGIVTEGPIVGMFDYVKAINAEYIVIHYSYINEVMINEAHLKSTKVFGYTIPTCEVRELVEMNVDGIITDFPADAQRILTDYK